MLEAELRSINGTWKYNKLEIHPLLLNKPLINDNGIFKYQLSDEESDHIMSALYPIYQGQLRPIIIKKCMMLTVNLPKYNKTRQETLELLSEYKLPPVEIYYGHTPETIKTSKFYNCLTSLQYRPTLTLGMLEIFDKFVNESEEDEWMLYMEDDVRVINVDKHDDLTKLCVPSDAELIRPYIGKNEPCHLDQLQYRVSSDGGLNHAIYVSVSACKKILHYAKTYKWKYVCDIDLYKLSSHGGLFPTGYDAWGLYSCNGKNDITGTLKEHEKIKMYHLSHCIFNQTSLPCC